MTQATQARTASLRRPKMEPSAQVKLDAARAKVLKSSAPSLKQLHERLGGWEQPELSGHLVK